MTEDTTPASFWFGGRRDLVSCGAGDGRGVPPPRRRGGGRGGRAGAKTTRSTRAQHGTHTHAHTHRSSPTARERKARRNAAWRRVPEQRPAAVDSRCASSRRVLKRALDCSVGSGGGDHPSPPNRTQSSAVSPNRDVVCVLATAAALPRPRRSRARAALPASSGTKKGYRKRDGVSPTESRNGCGATVARSALPSDAAAAVRQGESRHDRYIWPLSLRYALPSDAAAAARQEES